MLKDNMAADKLSPLFWVGCTLYSWSTCWRSCRVSWRMRFCCRPHQHYLPAEMESRGLGGQHECNQPVHIWCRLSGFGGLGCPDAVPSALPKQTGPSELSPVRASILSSVGAQELSLCSPLMICWLVGCVRFHSCLWKGRDRRWHCSSLRAHHRRLHRTTQTQQWL